MMQNEDEARELNNALVDELKANGFLVSASIEAAFRNVLRHHFLPARPWNEVYANAAIVTRFHPEHGWPISSSTEPAAMALMLEQLQVQPGMRVLEIGTGTGYNAAVLAELVGSAGRVWTLDLDADICQEARFHLQAAGSYDVSIVCVDGWHGYPEAAPYDRIVVTASAYDLSPAWLAQLREDGLLVLPWSLLAMAQRGLAFRKQAGRFVLTSNVYYGFMPLRGEFGRPPILAGHDGFVWKSDRLAAPEIERLSRLTEGPASERICPLLPEPVQAMEDLLFFIAVQEPCAIVRQRMTAGNELQLWPGLTDAVQSALCLLEQGWPVRLLSWGGTALADELQGYIQRWVDLGCPPPERVQMAAYPRHTAPAPADNERLARRRWFDYLISWIR